MFNWIQDFVEECGNAHPTEATVYIPKYIAKTTLYSMYKSSWEADKMPIGSLPSSSMFYTVLEDQFSHVKFLRKTLLGRCDFCMSIPLKKKSITNEEEALAFKAACQAHYQLHSNEHLLYGNRTHTSQMHPNRVLHLVLDCPDSYDLPHIVPVTKDTAMDPKLPVHAVGCINHSLQRRDFTFFTGQYSKNPNLLLTVLYLHLVDQFIVHKKHPPILWLQLDNCFKENKN